MALSAPAASHAKPVKRVLFLGSSLSSGAYAASARDWWGALVCDAISDAFPEFFFKRYGDADATYYGSQYAASGKGSIAISPTWSAVAQGGPFNAWMSLDPAPDYVVIECGVNNLVAGATPGTTYDVCLDRYEEGVTRGYETHAEAEAWYITDLTDCVEWLYANYGIPSASIFVLGQWPMGIPLSFDDRGARYYGGTEGGSMDAFTPKGYDLLLHWNNDIIQPTVETLGCNFVDMLTVYGVDFMPYYETNPYLAITDTAHPEYRKYQVHVSPTGSRKWADHIAPQIIENINQ